MKIAWKKAICYSGYREGQSPVTGIIPTKEEILEDLMLLKEEGFPTLGCTTRTRMRGGYWN